MKKWKIWPFVRTVEFKEAKRMQRERHDAELAAFREYILGKCGCRGGQNG